MSDVVKVYHLLTGEILIAREVSVNLTEYIIKAPFSMMQYPQGHPQEGKFAMVPTVEFTEGKGDIGIGISSVFFRYDAPEKIAKGYAQSTSGIILPQGTTIPKILQP